MALNKSMTTGGAIAGAARAYTEGPVTFVTYMRVE
jgi:hypothetical protein